MHYTRSLGNVCTQNKKKTKQSKPPLHKRLNWKANESFKGRGSAFKKNPKQQDHQTDC